MSSELLNMVGCWAEENYPYNFCCFENGMHPCEFPADSGPYLENVHAPFVVIGADRNNFGVVYTLNKGRHPNKILIYIVKGALTKSPSLRYKDNDAFCVEDPEFFDKIKNFVYGATNA
jgi:hypothetical protein